MSIKVVMPQLGESVVEGTVSRWLKREGERINEYEPLLEVSTDKVDTEVPAPASGTVIAIYVQEGQTVEAGSLLALIGEAGDLPSDDSKPVPQSAPVSVQKTGNGTGGHLAQYSGHVTPVVARMVAEHQLDLSQITGTGRGGRITKQDVESYLSERSETPVQTADIPAWEQVGTGSLFKPTVEYGEEEADGKDNIQGRTKPAPSLQKPVESPAQRLHPVEAIPQGTPGELVKLTPLRKAIAEHMVRSKLHTAPHVTTVFEADMTAVLAHREANKDTFAKQGVNLTLTAYFVAASVVALREHTYVNAQWTDEGIYLHHGVHVGVAVAIDGGLIVPVIKNAQDYNLLGLARSINDLAVRAREKHLKPDEVQGGTFTISNHGVGGSLFATPVINQPQTGILGVGVMEKRVKVINDAIAIRPCVYLSLTFDHRVLDGAGADAFMLTLKQHLESFA